MLVKLTEVCNNGAVTTKKLYSLREVFINPEHVVMIREEKRMKELNENGKVASGLDGNHRFSKLFSLVFLPLENIEKSLGGSLGSQIHPTVIRM